MSREAEKPKKSGNSCIVKKYKRHENPIDVADRWRRSIKYIYQRAKYGYCDSDTWSIDYWFLSVVPGMLEELMENTSSYPCAPGAEAHAIYGSGVPKDVDDEGANAWKNIAMSARIRHLKCLKNGFGIFGINEIRKDYR